MRFSDVAVGKRVKFLESCGCIKKNSTGTRTAYSGIMIDRLLGNIEIFIRQADPLVEILEKAMQLKVKEIHNGIQLGNVSCNQLIRLLEAMGKLPRDTIGYLISGHQFVVVAGASFSAYTVNVSTPVEILKSGTLLLEIQCD
ncbi:hypothetical protein LCGC14_2807820 [marine sediment metagenome]|uniref:Uncharacterized protein n=1 Tax=marine sediment metagenome TaxID=412755 RepID=A0A0F8YKS3_9ZZZZ